MQIIPTIELLNGGCVTLRRGQFQDPIRWHVDPLATAQAFVAAGAQALRITDFDAIVGGDGADDLIEEIIRQVGVPVQIAGGIRTRERAEHWIDKGAAQVVIGTMAVLAPRDVLALAKYYPDMVVLSLDIAGGRLMTHGWGTESALDPADFMAIFADAPLAAVIVTDIDGDAGDVDAQVGLISGLAQGTRHRVLASGLVDSLDDVSRLKYVPGIDGAIVGRALMRKDFTLQEALAIAVPQAEKKAEFT